MVTLLTRASRLALDLVFPPQCAICRRQGAMLCATCVAGLPVADGDRCDRCWIASRASPCGDCRTSLLAFDSARSAFVFDGNAREAVHRFKYQGLHALAEPMAALMLAHADLTDIDLIVPVPLHRRRERARGYNQAALLAKSLAAHAGVRSDVGAAKRVRATAPLAKATGRAERLEIVRDAFRAAPERVEGRRVMLVDDVITTGATLDACASALLAAGARGVRCVTWARTD